MKMFSIRDIKAEGFSLPFFSENAHTAMRELSTRLKSDQVMSKYAEDFDVFESGVFNQETGLPEPYGDQPHHVISVRELLEIPDDNSSTRIS